MSGLLHYLAQIRFKPFYSHKKFSLLLRMLYGHCYYYYLFSENRKNELNYLIKIEKLPKIHKNMNLSG